MSSRPIEPLRESELAPVERQNCRLRSPETVMRSARIGAFHQTWFSFARSLVRRMAEGGWTIARKSMDISAENIGEAHYEIDCVGVPYQFYVFATHLEPGQRSDRAIATAWDYTFALREGRVDVAALADLRFNVPMQDDGRYDSRVLAITRANKSGRIFDDVVDHLAVGQQPDKDAIIKVGYLIRTTAVFANGMFGMSDFDRLRGRSAFGQPFAAQMMVVYLARLFSFDVVDYLAKLRAPDTAVPLSSQFRRFLGVGNATGLGMAPFLVNHPRIISKWIVARETAIACMRSQTSATDQERSRFMALLERSIAHVREWRTTDERQRLRLAVLESELVQSLDRHRSVKHGAMPHSGSFWRAVLDHAAQNLSEETQELLASLILEVRPDLNDDLEDDLIAEDFSDTQPGSTLAEFKSEIEDRYDWALPIDFEDAGQNHYFWYRSEVKYEPRLGVRGKDDGADRELSLDIARMVNRLYHHLDDLDRTSLSETVDQFLLRHPEHREAVQRVWSTKGYPYAEIRENLLSAELLPLNLLRCKLSFLGATKFDPKSDRWLRVAIFQGAPLPVRTRIPQDEADDWFCPAFAL